MYKQGNYETREKTKINGMNKSYTVANEMRDLLHLTNITAVASGKIIESQTSPKATIVPQIDPWRKTSIGEVKHIG